MGCVAPGSLPAASARANLRVWHWEVKRAGRGGSGGAYLLEPQLLVVDGGLVQVELVVQDDVKAVRGVEVDHKHEAVEHGVLRQVAVADARHVGGGRRLRGGRGGWVGSRLDRAGDHHGLVDLQLRLLLSPEGTLVKDCPEGRGGGGVEGWAVLNIGVHYTCLIKCSCRHPCSIHHPESAGENHLKTKCTRRKSTSVFCRLASAGGLPGCIGSSAAWGTGRTAI